MATRHSWFRTAIILCLAMPLGAMPSARAQEEGPSAGDELSVEQARLADRFTRLEQVVGRLAELSSSTDPRRARLLREAIAQSRELDVNLRFEAIVKLLEEERLSAAANNQTELRGELDSLLALLLKADRDNEIASERERIRNYLKELGRLIRMQKGVRARTEGGDDEGGLSKDQQQIAEDTSKLGNTIEENETEESADAQGKGSSEEDAPDGDASKKGGDESGESSKSDSAEGEQPEKSADDDSKLHGKRAAGEPTENESPGGEQSQGKQDEGQPSEGQPSEGQPSQGEPSEGQPSEGQPSQGDPAQGQPGQGQSSPPSGGEPGESGPPQPQSPTDRATEKLRQAQQKMDQALEKLGQAERDGAAEKQREALQELEQAKAELERVLRQLREEEMERTLTQLAARFRKMLEMQVAVYEGTKRLDRIAEANRDHDDEIEAARLSRQETAIVREADKAMLLLREEGSSVAFPEAVEQMRDDMQQVASRLAAQRVDTITQGLEEDIIAALEETIAALEKAMKDLEKNGPPPGQSSGGGQPGEAPLVDQLAELKMIRSLQMRIKLRTERYGKMIGGEVAENEELRKAVQGLGERQQRVYRATQDLLEGANR